MTKRHRKKWVDALSLVLPVLLFFAVLNCFTTYLYYRNLMFCKQDGYCGYMTPFVWMFIKTYEKLREFIIQSKSITTLVQMEYRLATRSVTDTP